MALPALQVSQSHICLISTWVIFNRIVELKLTLSKSTQVTKQTELELKMKIQLLTPIVKQDNLSSEQSQIEGLLEVQKTTRHFLVQEIKVDLDNIRTLTLTLSE